MNSNRFRFYFLIFLALPVLWWSYQALLVLYPYFYLSEQAEATAIEWSVVDIESEDFRIQADFTYPLNGQVGEGVTVFERPRFRNHWAAQKKIPEYQARTWTVHHSSKEPFRSTLDRSFPFKKTSYAVILWILYGYFIFLGFFVGRK